MQAFSSKKVKAFPLFFQETYDRWYIRREKEKELFLYCLWEFCFWVIPMEIGTIWVINIVKSLLIELGQHVIIRRPFQTFHLDFVFPNLFLTHSIFSHGKLLLLLLLLLIYYYQLCLVNGLSVPFVCLIYHWQVCSRPLMPEGRTRWEQVTPEALSHFLLWGPPMWMLTKWTFHERFCTLRKRERPSIQS